MTSSNHNRFSINTDINTLYQNYNFSINKIVDHIQSLKNNKIRTNVLNCFINVDYKNNISDFLKRSLNSFLAKSSHRDGQIIKQILLAMPENYEVLLAISNLLEKQIFEQKLKQKKRFDQILELLGKEGIEGEKLFNEMLELKITNAKDTQIKERLSQHQISETIFEQLLDIAQEAIEDNFAYLIKNKIGLYKGIGVIGNFILGKGFRINQVIEHSKAEKLNLKPGDVITKVNDRLINELSRKQAINLLSTPVSLVIVRGIEEMVIKNDKALSGLVDRKTTTPNEDFKSKTKESKKSITAKIFAELMFAKNSDWTDQETEKLARII